MYTQLNEKKKRFFSALIHVSFNADYSLPFYTIWCEKCELAARAFVSHSSSRYLLKIPRA